MLTAFLFAAALGAMPQAAIGQPVTTTTAPAPPAAAPAPGAAAAEPNTETAKVCRWEAVIGSNRRNRVCRDVPRQGVQDQSTREFMRDHQRSTPPSSG